MKENRKVVLKGNKKAIIKYNLEKIFDKSLDFIGFAIGLAILIFFINSVKDLDGYFKDRDYLLQLLKNENVVLIKSNVCKDIKEEGNRFVVNAECNAKEILRKRIDDNIFGFLLSDKFKKDQLPEKISKLTPIKHKNRFKNLGDGLSNKKLEKALSIKIKTKETKISKIENENKPVGCLEGDCWNNFSKKQYPSGYYIGEFNNGTRNGQGTFVWSDGDKYIGEWKNEKKTGQGTFVWSDGDKYIGEWKNGQRTGQGTYIWPNGNKYSGQFRNNKFSGEGVYNYKNGDKYIGEYAFGRRNGKGTFIWSNDNTVHVGVYIDGKIGNGTQINPDGSKLSLSRIDGKIVAKRIQNTNINQNLDLLLKQLKRNNDLQTSRMLLDISKSLMGSNKNTSTLNLNNLNNGGGWLSGSSSSGMYKTCSYSSGLGTRTKTVFASAPCPMVY